MTFTIFKKRGGLEWEAIKFHQSKDQVRDFLEAVLNVNGGAYFPAQDKSYFYDHDGWKIQYKAEPNN